MSATVERLGKLHEVVADVIEKQLTATIEDDEGNEISIVSDKAVSNAIAFLKNNDISAVMGKSASLANIQNELDKRRAERKNLLKTKPEDNDGVRATS